ncbi:MAG: TIGR02281 family clan AA aspartic protease [Gammaproteobacteria bacterium]|nr:TIGR02281 family clan AA aspartic protease [Gammaproteobacteria bacterium]
MKKTSYLFLVMTSCFSGLAAAIDQIEVQALFAGKAVIMIDGNRRTLAVGDTSPEGVHVVAADSKSVILEIDGEQKTYPIGNSITMSYQKPKSVKEQIFVNSYGMYKTHGSINGQSVRFLVDTGATSVAMSEVAAKRLGIAYRLDGQPTQTSTASGIAKAWRIKLKTITVGSLKQRQIDAVVIEGNHPSEILLGMTFLERLTVEKEAGVMTLEQKY